MMQTHQNGCGGSVEPKDVRSEGVEACRATPGRVDLTTWSFEDYLGDGVYASYDGYHVILDLRAQDASRIALEPAVLAALLQFRDRAIDAHTEAVTKAKEVQR